MCLCIHTHITQDLDMHMICTLIVRIHIYIYAYVHIRSRDEKHQTQVVSSKGSSHETGQLAGGKGAIECILATSCFMPAVKCFQQRHRSRLKHLKKTQMSKWALGEKYFLRVAITGFAMTGFLLAGLRQLSFGA